jgi:hypothetical protein
MDGDLTYRYVAHPLKKGGYYISIQKVNVQPESSAKNVKNKPSKTSDIAAKWMQLVQSIQSFKPKNIQDKRTGKLNNVQFVEEHTLSKILAAGNPITLGDGLRTEERDTNLPDLPMGSLILRSSPAGKPIKEMITHDHGPDGFEIIYRRTANLKEPANLQALHMNDAAMIVRVFMLTKIATARLEMRAALLDVATHRNKLVDEQKKIKGGAGAAEKTAARARLRKLLHQLETDAHDGDADPSRRISIEHHLAIVMQTAQHWIEHHKGWVYLISMAAFSAAMVWVWMPYVLGYHHALSSALGWILFGLFGAGGILFLLNALNLKSVDLRIEEKIHEETIERLNVTLASLVQTNANVAAINLHPRPQEGFPSELLLHQMDDALHLKERLVSIEGVIKAREVHLASSVSHIEEHRDSVRRSIMAAGSGVFVGFFTYEVGESLMDYLHVTHQEDKSAMLYWLMANSERIRPHAEATPGAPASPAATHSVAFLQGAAATNQHSNEQGLNPAPRQHHRMGPPGDDLDATNALSQLRSGVQGEASASGHPVQTTAHGPALDPDFVKGYHRPELYAQSWLLTITLVVSVLTAWIAIRKPAAEKAAGHAHH